MEITDKRKEFDRLKITVRDNRAECVAPGEKDVIHMTLTGGRWYIRADDVMRVNPGQAKLWSAFAKVLRAKRSRPGQPGATAQSLDKELAQAMKKAAEGG